MIKTLLICFFITMFLGAGAQTIADSNKHSPVRTLTYDEYEAFLKGQALNEQVKVAEINHYPMPDQVLKLKKELELDPAQVKKITDAAAYMHRRRLQAGGSVISNEKMLDSLFRINQVDEGNLIFYVNRYGAYQSEIRIAILQACIDTKRALSPQQLAKFWALQKAR